MKRLLKIKNEIAEIERLNFFVDELGEAFELDSALTMSLNLVLEEAVSNIILYAYPHPMGDEISINAEKTDKLLVFTITDSGEEFDPTAVPEADISLSAEERPIGGLGIYLIKKIMNEIEYQRIEGNNVFTLKKVLQ